ncbi:hypothetical protein BKA93DRAFT_481716 [Sparassis latifolia]
MLDPGKSFRASTGRFRRIFLPILLALGVLTLLSQHLSVFIYNERPVSHIPLHAAEIVQKCRALEVKPGPPEAFYERSQSDRFQPGTRPVVIRNATLWTGRWKGFEVIKGDLLLGEGLIKSVGRVAPQDAYEDAVVIDAHGSWVTPGLVDAHAHLGVLPSPLLAGANDGGSTHGTVQPWLRSLDGLNTHDDGYLHSMAGGVTTTLILPGSGNAIGGQAFVIKLRPTDERSPTSMLVEPPFGLNGSEVDTTLPPRWRHMKQACGENPARAYGDTRMDTTWAFRRAYDTARKVKLAQDEFCEKALSGEWEALAGRTFPDSLQWEALVDVLRGRVKVHTHCYEELDLDNFVRLSNEFQFPVAAFHHAAEAYLVPDVLKRAYGHPPAIATFATFGRAKREFYRQSEFAPRILADNDIDIIMKSDHPALFSRFLMHEAAQANYYGLADNLALASVISTPATVLGLAHRIGFLKEGYDADVVVWDSHPLSLGATPTQVIVDGILQFDPPHAVVKPASHQLPPETPDFDREASDVIKHEGLPPLFPVESKTDVVIFTNVTNVWVRDAYGAGIVNLHDTQGQASDGSVVVVEHGKMVCSEAPSACASYLALVDTVTIDLRGGSIQPGLVGISSTLGLQEIPLEPSTRDGFVFDPLLTGVPSIAGGDGYLPRALDGLQFGTRDALQAYRSGVTVSVTAPTHLSFLGGLSTAFSLGSVHKLEKGAVVQSVTAVHVSILQDGQPSVSTKIAALRRLLLDPPSGESGRWFGKVTEGAIPLVVDAHSADIIATLIVLKKEVEVTTGTPIQMTIVGASEAHLLAKELREADVGIVLMTPRPYPLTWDSRRLMAGPPLTHDSAIAHLIAHNVTVAIGPQGTVVPLEVSAWAVRNMRFDAAWALGEAPNVLTKASAIALVSSNVEKLLGVHVGPGEGDLVATSGGDLLSFEGKVVAIISPRMEKVDMF